MGALIAANLRHHGRRYAATLLAVSIAVAFVSAALVFGGSLTVGIRNQIAGTYDGAAAVVNGGSDDGSWNLGDAQEVLAKHPDVAEIYPSSLDVFKTGSGSDNESWISVSPLAGEQLGTQGLPDDLPSARFPAVITQEACDRLGVGLGSSLPLIGDNWYWDGDEYVEGTEAPPSVDLTVVAVVDAPKNSMGMGGAELWTTPEVLKTLNPEWSPGELLVGLKDQRPSLAEQQTLVQELQSLLTESQMDEASVITAHERVDQELSAVNTNQAVLTLMLLLFPVIAGVVALIVVGTTFQVIFRQRERELALLRVIGATGRQVRRLMSIESAAVGFIGSTIGLLVGIFGGAAIAVAADVVPNYGQALGAMTWPQALIVLGVGTILTLLAGFRPALRASRVPPVNALAGISDSPKQLSRRRVAVAVISACLAVCLAFFTWFLVNVPEDQKENRFLLVLLVAVLTAAAVIAFVTAVLPQLTSSMGRFRGSESFHLAAANTARNPGRTAATGIAVFIGVTLISMVTLGAQSLRATSHAALDRSAPIDLVVSSPQGLTATQIESIRAVKGVQAMDIVPSLMVTASWDQSDGTGIQGPAALLDTSQSLTSVRGTLPVAEEGQVLIPWYDSADPRPVELCVEEVCVNAEGIPTGAPVDSQRFLAASGVITELGGAQSSQVWLMLERPDDYPAVLGDIQAISGDFEIEGAVAMRATVDQIVNVLVMVIVALLAVSVLVALVGITNTLSLSVAERMRENGLLRALGMTRKQVRSMLSWEALLIGGMSTIAGLISGAYFGIVGFNALPLGTDGRLVDIPWLQWLAIVIVAIGAAWLASIVPGRRASRVSPVEALAAE